jgi:hypothetical protein
VVLCKAVAIADVRSLNAMQRHVHRADTQHRGVKVEAVEQAFVEMPPQLVVLKPRSAMVASGVSPPVS